MAVRILYFASVKEAVGCGTEEFPLSTEISSVAALRLALVARGGSWKALETARNLKCAVNERMVPFEAMIADGDVVAFFPPVTGG